MASDPDAALRRPRDASTRPRSSRRSPGASTPASRSASASRFPTATRRPTARRSRGARVHGLRGGRADRGARRSTSRSSGRAPTAACRTSRRRRASCAATMSPPHVKALVVPGSQAVGREAEARGLHQIFREAGFEWRGAGCSMCLGMNTDRLEGRQVCASSSNRNFKGRQGSPTGRTLLMSPAMVAAAADRRRSRGRPPADCWRGAAHERGHRGRSPGAGCRCAATTSTPTGSCRRGFCGSVSFEGLETHLFEDDRATDPRHPFGDPRYSGRGRARREPQLRLRVVARARAAGARAGRHPAIVGESFSEIFQGNAAMLGVPCFTADRDVDRGAAGARRADAGDDHRRRGVDTGALTAGHLTAADRAAARAARRVPQRPVESDGDAARSIRRGARRRGAPAVRRLAG